jgi:hypothetical protein
MSILLIITTPYSNALLLLHVRSCLYFVCCVYKYLWSPPAEAYDVSRVRVYIYIYIYRTRTNFKFGEGCEILECAWCWKRLLYTAIENQYISTTVHCVHPRRPQPTLNLHRTFVLGRQIRRNSPISFAYTSVVTDMASPGLIYQQQEQRRQKRNHCGTMYRADWTQNNSDGSNSGEFRTW